MVLVFLRYCNTDPKTKPCDTQSNGKHEIWTLSTSQSTAFNLTFKDWNETLKDIDSNSKPCISIH